MFNLQDALDDACNSDNRAAKANIFSCYFRKFVKQQQCRMWHRETVASQPRLSAILNQTKN